MLCVFVLRQFVLVLAFLFCVSCYVFCTVTCFVKRCQKTLTNLSLVDEAVNLGVTTQKSTVTNCLVCLGWATKTWQHTTGKSMVSRHEFASQPLTDFVRPVVTGT